MKIEKIITYIFYSAGLIALCIGTIYDRDDWLYISGGAFISLLIIELISMEDKK